MTFESTTEPYTFNGDARQRVKSVTFYDLRNSGSGGSRTTGIVPLSQIASDNSISRTDRPLHTEAGHLIAVKRFGGPDRHDNLVPMYADFNSSAGSWGKFELTLASHLNERLNHINLSITVNYPDNTTSVPSSFSANITHREGADTSNLGGFFQHIPPAIYYEALDNDDHDFARTLRVSQAAMERANWCVEHDLRSSGVRGKEVGVGGVKPDDVDFTNPEQKAAFYAGRPYSVLDYLYLKERATYDNKLTGPNIASGISDSLDFSGEQKTFILYVNQCLSEGYLNSDLYDRADLEQVEHLAPGSTDHMPQIDHHLPKGHGGSNAYSNARVISGIANKNLNNGSNAENVEHELYPKNLFRDAELKM